MNPFASIVRFRCNRIRMASATAMLAFLCSHQATADHPRADGIRTDLSLKQLTYRSWSMDDGLPSDEIIEIVQTSDDYLWLATNRGLSRFDGVRFVNFNRANTPELTNDKITTLHEGRENCLWIGTEGGGLVQCKLSQPPKFRTFSELRGRQIKCLFEDSEGTLWIGTDNYTWTVKDDICEPQTAAPINVLAIAADSNGILWFGATIRFDQKAVSQNLQRIEATPGLFRYAAGKFERRTEADGFPTEGRDQSVTALCSDDTGGMWVSTNARALIHYKEGFAQYYPKSLGSFSTKVFQDKSGAIWTLSRNAGPRRSIGDKSEVLPQKDTMPYARCIAQDREGNIWLGGSFRGLRRVSNPEIARVDLGRHYSVATCVLEDSKGRLWFGTGYPPAVNHPDNLLLKTENGWEKWGLKDGIPNYVVRCISESPDGSLWIGTNKGLAQWNDGKIVVPDWLNAAGKATVKHVHVDQKGDIWFGLQPGTLWRIRDEKTMNIKAFGSSSVKWFHEHDDGSLWIGSSRGIYVWKDEQLEQLRAPGLDELSMHAVTTCFKDEEGVFWFGTDGNGLLRFAEGRFKNWNSEHGLHDDVIHAIVEDKRGWLWLGGPTGLSSFPKNSLEQLERGELSRLDVRIHDLGMGIDENNRTRFDEANRPNVLCRDDGSLYFITSAGAINVTPEGPRRNSIPPIVHVESVRIDSNAHGIETPFEVRSGFNRIDFNFTANTFLVPELAQFHYQLTGHDDHWMDAGSLRSVGYTDLSPGEYVFHVKASNGHGVWSNSSAEFPFKILPRWFETRAFQGLAAFGFFAVILLSTVLYTRNVRLQNAAFQKEIHDRNVAEANLQKSEDRFRDLAESTQAIPWEADAQTQRFTFVGNQAVAILGYPVEEWMTEDFWLEHLHPEDRTEAVEGRQHELQHGRSHQFEYRMVAADGSVVWLHDVVHVVMKDGVADKLRGFLVDVTDRRSAEEKANDYLQQLARMNRAASLGEMATSIAHEVNQPLFAIVGNAQIAQRLLKQDQPDMKEVRAALGDIVGDGNRAASIIDNVRSLVRKEQQSTEPLDLNQVALDAIKFITPEIRKRGLVLKTELADSLPAINGNSIELQQVILNLVINGAQAMRHTENGYNELLLRTTAQDGFVELAVKDHGVGIDPDQGDCLFEPFFTTKPQGMGMGLAINRTIIETHQGRIWATANNPRGATFRFQLPAAGEIKS